MPDVLQVMRDEWNERAREDAHYYVAFRRRNQDDESFFATASDALHLFDRELKRGTPGSKATRRFLEIGCGPGRLMKLMSKHCGEIHGIDVSDGMIAHARRNLAGISHAHVHVGTGSTLDRFDDNQFDFVYSYAVFQHIPSREIVFNYFREIVRVLKPEGLARLQINGLSKDTKAHTTWSGVCIGAEEIRSFAKEKEIQLLALEDPGTQYMWTTWRKAPAAAPINSPAIVRVANISTSEPLVPVKGRFAVVSLWVEHLNDAADLNTLQLRIGGRPATLAYVGYVESNGWRQINAILPNGLSPGMATFELHGATHSVRLLPAPPVVPRVLSVTDGINLSENHITSGVIKLIVEEFEPIENLTAMLDTVTLDNIETFCVDPSAPRHEINLHLPQNTPLGEHRLVLHIGLRRVASCLVVVL